MHICLYIVDCDDGYMLVLGYCIKPTSAVGGASKSFLVNNLMLLTAARFLIEGDNNHKINVDIELITHCK